MPFPQAPAEHGDCSREIGTHDHDDGSGDDGDGGVKALRDKTLVESRSRVAEHDQAKVPFPCAKATCIAFTEFCTTSKVTKS
jgi:hypothetical protein